MGYTKKEQEKDINMKKEISQEVASELLEACKLALIKINLYHMGTDLARQLEQAIAKAEVVQIIDDETIRVSMEKDGMTFSQEVWEKDVSLVKKYNE